MESVTIGPCTLYCGDCLEVLPTLEAGSVDAVVTDPPYGISYKPGGGGTGPAKRFTNADAILGDDKPFDPSCLIALDVPLICWGGSNFANRLPASRGWLVWDKKCGIYETNQFSDCELAWTTINGPIKIFRHRWTGYHRDGCEQGKFHPTQKPIELMAWCLEFMPNSQTILDPFMGSGTTGVACIRTERKFVGIEKEPKYFDIACKRIEREWQLKRSELPFDKPPVEVQRELIPA